MDVAVAREPRAVRINLPSRGGEMSALEFGPAERPVDIVFTHANGFNARTYASILAPLAADFHVLAIDQRGHGRSGLKPEIEGRTSWYGLRDDLLALLEALDLRNVVLGGHSMGGTASILASAEAPGRVKSLVMFDPVVLTPESIAASAGGETIESPLVQGALRRRALFPSHQAAVEAYTGRGAFRSWTPAMLADYVADGFRERPDGQVELTCAPEWEASNFTSQAHDTWDAFARSTAPITIFRAENGSTCRVEDHEAQLAASGRITLETVPGTTHFLPMERPDVVARALRAAASKP
ncbi:MAG: alpha/beta hydrolase [Pseudomonadota bacterium]